MEWHQLSFSERESGKKFPIVSHMECGAYIILCKYAFKASTNSIFQLNCCFIHYFVLCLSHTIFFFPRLHLHLLSYTFKQISNTNAHTHKRISAVDSISYLKFSLFLVSFAFSFPLRTVNANFIFFKYIFTCVWNLDSGYQANISRRFIFHSNTDITVIHKQTLQSAYFCINKYFFLCYFPKCKIKMQNISPFWVIVFIFSSFLHSHTLLDTFFTLFEEHQEKEKLVLIPSFSISSIWHPLFSDTCFEDEKKNQKR